jgi:DNA invertase Pin-like site-specific DNA recombinase
MSIRLEPPPVTLPSGSTVWAYLRDSGGPTQERSIQQQREMLIEYCNQYNLVLSHQPFEDVHKSGGSTQGRDDFSYMISLSATPEKPKGLLIWNFARFSRGGSYDAQLYKSILRHRGIIIHSLTDKIPEGEFGPIIEAIIDVANKQKKDEASAGAWRGLRHNVKQGAVPGTPPRGIIRTPIKTISTDGIERTAHRWDSDPAFKHRINSAFQMKAEGKSLAQIHKETKLYTSLNSYVTFFSNPIYIGTLQYGEMTIENYCAPTIPKKLWNKVQVIMQANADRKNINSKTEHPRRKSSVYILSGIIKCARCGSPMNGLSTPQPYGKDYRRYNCATAKNKKTCAIKPVPAELVEKLVLDQLHIFFDDPKNLINILTTFQKDHAAESDKVEEKRTSLKHQLSATRKKIINLTNAIAEKSHSPAMLKKLTDLEEEETAILSGLEQLKAQTITPIVVPTLDQAKELAHNIQVDLKSKDYAFIRQTLLGILSEVIVDRFDKHVVGRMVYYHIPNVKKKLLADNMSIIPAPVGAQDIGAL